MLLIIKLRVEFAGFIGVFKFLVDGFIGVFNFREFESVFKPRFPFFIGVFKILFMGGKLYTEFEELIKIEGVLAAAAAA